MTTYTDQVLSYNDAAYGPGKGSGIRTPEPAEAKDDTLGFLISDKLSNTGMHGLPNVQRAGSWMRKIFWALIVLAGIGEWERER